MSDPLTHSFFFMLGVSALVAMAAAVVVALLVLVARAWGWLRGKVNDD